MNTILAALRSIVLGAAVLVSGVSVTRSSLLGFDVAGKVGLDASEALQVIEALVVDASWPAPVTVRVVPTLASVRAAATKAAPVKAPRAKSAPSFYAKVVDAVKAHRNLGTLNLRNAPLRDHSDHVVIDVLASKGAMAGQHAEVALVLARALLLDGFAARAVGSDVHVSASVA